MAFFGHAIVVYCQKSVELFLSLGGDFFCPLYVLEPELPNIFPDSKTANDPSSNVTFFKSNASITFQYSIQSLFY